MHAGERIGKIYLFKKIEKYLLLLTILRVHKICHKDTFLLLVITIIIIFQYLKNYSSELIES